MKLPLSIILILASLACGAQAAVPVNSPVPTITPAYVEMVVIAPESLNIRADQTEKSPADPKGLKAGDVVKVYLVCTGGQMKDWVSINRDCTQWVKASWLKSP